MPVAFAAYEIGGAQLPEEAEGRSGATPRPDHDEILIQVQALAPTEFGHVGASGKVGQGITTLDGAA